MHVRAASARLRTRIGDVHRVLDSFSSDPRHGLRVLMVDRGRYGADTLSTHALMRGGVLQLARWGVLPRIQAAGTPPVRRATFLYSGEPISVPIKPRDGVDAL